MTKIKRITPQCLRVDFTAVAGQASFTGSYRNNLRSDSYEYDKEETHVGYYFQVTCQMYKCGLK